MIPNPSGFSKMIGSLRPLLWMNSYVKSGEKQEDNKTVVFSFLDKMPVCSYHHTTGSCCHSAFSHVHECPYIKYHEMSPYLFPAYDWPVQSWTAGCWLSPLGQMSSCRQSLRLRCRRHGNVAGYQFALKWKLSSQFEQLILFTDFSQCCNGVLFLSSRCHSSCNNDELENLADAGAFALYPCSLWHERSCVVSVLWVGIKITATILQIYFNVASFSTDKD